METIAIMTIILGALFLGGMFLAWRNILREPEIPVATYRGYASKLYTGGIVPTPKKPYLVGEHSCDLGEVLGKAVLQKDAKRRKLTGFFDGR